MNDSTFRYDAPEDSPGLLLWQTTIVWQRLIKRALEPYGVSHPQFVLLANLLWFEEHQQEVNQIMLVKMSKLDKMTVSKALRKLCTDGFVSRVESSVDTRAKTVTLTDLGRDKIKQLVPIVESVDENFFAGIVPTDRKSLLRVFAQLSEA